MWEMRNRAEFWLDGRPRRTWEDNIKMELMVVGWEGVDRIHVAKFRDRWRVFVNTIMNLRVP
jgi:hypothetical protein